MPLVLYRRKGSKIWHYRGTLGPTGGRERLRGSTGTSDKNTASREVATVEARWWKGHQDGPGAILTFDQACSKFKADGRPFMVGNVDVVEAAHKHFTGKLVAEIRPQMIRDFADEIYGHCTGASKNRMAVAPVRSVINHCAAAELCDFIRIKGFPEHHKEKEPATLPWVQSFQEITKPHLGAYSLFMFLTGARPSEGLAVDRERDLDLSRAEATVRMTKVEKDKLVTVTRTPHLPSLLVATLANLEPVDGRPLFYYHKYGDMRETWEFAAKKITGPLLTPHCCRHGFATELLRRQVDVHTVAWLGGWASAKQVLETYGHAIKQRDITEVLASSPQIRAAFDDVTHNAIEIEKLISNMSDDALRAEIERRSTGTQLTQDDDEFSQVIVQSA